MLLYAFQVRVSLLYTLCLRTAKAYYGNLSRRSFQVLHTVLYPAAEVLVMDSVTHLVAGALTPLAFKNAPKTRLMTVFGILCGELPDIDILAGRSPEVILSFHRGITHALIMQPLFALVMALIFHRALQKRDAAGSWSFGKTWAVALTALCIHLFLDCMTTFGTQIFLPFSAYRVALPAMYIIDLALTLPLIAVWVVLLRRGRGRRLARLGLAWALCYPLLCLGLNYGMAAHLSARYAQPGNPRGITRLQLSPEPFSPLNWKVVAESAPNASHPSGQYLMARYVPFLNKGPLAFAAYDKADPALWRSLRRAAPLFAMYADFAAFPFQTTRHSMSGGSLITFRDLRYEATLPGLMAAVGRADGLFLMQARLNADGSLAAYRFLHRGREAADTPWRTAAPSGKG